MRKDFLISPKEKKAAVSYRKGFPLLFPWLPTGTTLRHYFGLASPQTGGQGRISSPFWEENSQQVKGPKSPIRGLRCGEQEVHGEPHEQRPHRGCQEGHTGLTLLSSRNLFLAAAASSCSAESCLSFSSSWRFRTATGSPFCVACQHGGWHISGDHHLQTHPLHPTRATSCPLLQGKIQLHSQRHPQGQPV